MKPDCPMTFEEVDALLAPGAEWNERLSKLGSLIRQYLTEVSPRVVHSNTQLTDAVLKWSGAARPSETSARRRLSKFVSDIGRRKEYADLVVEGPEIRYYNFKTKKHEMARSRYWRFLRAGEATINSVPTKHSMGSKSEPNAEPPRLYTAAEVAAAVSQALQEAAKSGPVDAGRYCFSCGRGVKRGHA